MLHPVDQAAGLRQLFAASRTRFVPVLSNPHVEVGGMLLERLATACNALGLHATVVDAGERAPMPTEIARVELAAAVEALSPGVAYLAARGLPIAHVDAHGSTAGFLRAVADAVPQTNVVLVHAGAADLARLFARRPVRGLLLASDHPDSVTHAYAGLKLLALRAGLMAHDLLLAASAQSPRVPRIVHHLGRCADEFVGAVLHASLHLDPAIAAIEPPSPALLDFVRSLLSACEAGTTDAWSSAAEPAVPAFVRAVAAPSPAALARAAH